MDITNRTVVVTGASSGIGAAIAHAMARAGAASVVLLARNVDGLKRVADEIEASGGRAHEYAVDLTNPREVEHVGHRIVAEVGNPDILINNAGSGQWKFLTDSTDEEIRQLMTMPYFAAAWLTRLFVPAMRERGSGHIVIISSVASRLAWPGATGYIAACRAMRGLSEALRADLYNTGVRVTHYESGPIESPYWRNNPGSRERVPGIARMLVPVLSIEEVAKAVVDGIRRNRRLIVVPSMMKLVFVLHYAFPWIVQWLMTRTGYRAKG